MSNSESRARKPVITTRTQKQTITPWKEQVPHLKYAFEEAQKLYKSSPPKYFKDPLTVSFDDATKTALLMQEKRAKQGASIIVALRKHTEKIIKSQEDIDNKARDHLELWLEKFNKKSGQSKLATKCYALLEKEQNINPKELASFIHRIVQKETKIFEQQIQPKIDYLFLKNGRFGGGTHQKIKTEWFQGLQDKIAKATVHYIGKQKDSLLAHQIRMIELLQKEKESNHQQKMEVVSKIGQHHHLHRHYQQQMTKMAPIFAADDYQDIQKLMDVGGIRESLAQAKLNEEVNRWNFVQNKPYDSLAHYIGMISGGYGSERMSTSTEPHYRQRADSFVNDAKKATDLASSIVDLGDDVMGLINALK